VWIEKWHSPRSIIGQADAADAEVHFLQERSVSLPLEAVSQYFLRKQPNKAIPGAVGLKSAPIVIAVDQFVRKVEILSQTIYQSHLDAPIALPHFPFRVPFQEDKGRTLK